jgi:hypothetical protein
LLLNKYKNKKVVIDGHKFDSEAEAKHYWFVLKPRLEAGEITNLQFQPQFLVTIRGKKICTYKADFQYFDKTATGPEEQCGALIVEDVKGYKTDVYRLKKKMVEAAFPGTLISEISAAKYRAKKYSL